MIIKKIISALLAQVLLLSVTVGSVSADQPLTASNYPEQFNNIVLFAQFNSLSESNFMEGHTDDMIAMCNDSTTYRSLSSYIDTISYGKMNVTSYFPQMKDGIIIPYVLSSDESKYTNCDQYAIEMIKNISVPEDMPLDGNSDGIVDNIVLVIDGKAESGSSPIWPKAFSVNGMTINDLKVGSANIQNSYQLLENTITGGVGVLCHEFMHSLGYPDLYRNGRTGVPVGQWDIMASNSVFLQYPLAYQRSAVSGWLESEDITKSGRYTLSPASSDSGNRLYLLKTPLSDTEFFAVEYRRQGKQYSDELDVKIYGTGLVVYRINTEEIGNYKSSHDAIYVFRPEETSLDAGEGDPFSSNYGGTGAPESVGSLDWNADITDGALVYSNGTNSGIMISDIVIDEESLTFSVDFADTSESELWESIGHDSLGGKLPYQLKTAADGGVYLIAADNGNAMLYRIENGELTAFGSPLGSGTYMDMNQPQLAFCGNTPYVLYQDKNYLLHLCSYDSSSGSWQELYKGTELAQYASMAADKSKLYFTYTTGSFPYSLNAACLDCETGKIVEYGKNIAANACNMSAAVLDGAPMIAYRDLNDENKPKLAAYHNGVWNIETISETACGTVSMSSDGTSALIAPSGEGNAIYKVSGGQMTKCEFPESISGNAFELMPVIADGHCYLAVNTQNPSELSVYFMNGTEWESAGNIFAMDVVNSLSLAYSDHTLYCSCFTTKGTTLIRSLSVGSRISGDVNADGIFNTADTVMMQKWLINSGELIDWRAGDLYEDGIINVFDMCLMRCRLLNK